MGLTVTPGAGGVRIQLRNDLRHPGFGWPRSLLSVPVAGEPAGELPAEAELTVVRSDTGEPVAHQVTVAPDPDGGGSRVVHLLTDLPAGAERSWLARRRDEQRERGPATVVAVTSEHTSTTIGNGLVWLRADHTGAGRVVEIGAGRRRLAEGTVTGCGTPRSCRVAVVASGPVFAELTQEIDFDTGARYRLTYRLVDGEDFVRLTEEFHPAAAPVAEDAQLTVTWSGFRPTHRYCPNRSDVDLSGQAAGERTDTRWERVDEKLGPGGALPFILAPYHNWISWWRQPLAAFWSDTDALAPAIFVLDISRWQDHQYALWGSATTLCARYSYRDEQLRWHFPLRQGSRSTAIAVLRRTSGGADAGRDIARQAAARLRWHAWLPLNTVARWVIDHREDRTCYPRVHHVADHPLPLSRTERAARLREVILTESATINSIPQGGPRWAPGPTPVSAREFHRLLMPLFDQLAAELDDGTYELACSTLQFMAHVAEDEWWMPTRNLLAGHPNFLADVKGLVAQLPLLFPNHPAARRMADHFEAVTALNIRFHTRPAVDAWNAQAGRWTENIGTYTWAHLDNVARHAALLRRNYDGHNRLHVHQLRDVARWVINTLSVPLDRFEGRRALPAQGAHAFAGPPSRFFRILGHELRNVDPLLAEHILWSTPVSDEDWEDFGADRFDHAGLLERASDTANTGTPVPLRSEKFTGYGVVLRQATGTPEEMSVILQQIDDGPNYRWGRAAGGGNGVIYYSAAGRRWSHNGPEHVGDGHYGDVECCTNFGVRAPGGYRDIGPYRAVGRGDLTEPLLDLAIAQHVQVNAGGNATPDYRYRGVLMVGVDYLVVHDAVRDDTVAGRFSWFVDDDQDFPAIAQLRPGAQYEEVRPRPVQRELRGRYPRVKGRHYDGHGDFVTFVSHRRDLTAVATPYGATVTGPHGRDDIVVSQSPRATDLPGGAAFVGQIGVVRAGDNGTAAAIIRGERLDLAGLSVEVSDGVAISLSITADDVRGQVHVPARGGTVTLSGPAARGSLYVDGRAADAERAGGRLRAEVPPGRHVWELTQRAPWPMPTRIVRTERHRDGTVVRWEPSAAALTYRLEHSADRCRTWRAAAETDGTSVTVAAPEVGAKAHVRVVPVGGAETGEPSPPYPMYGSTDPPPAPDGLLLEPADDAVVASWGEVLGAVSYRLYRRARGESSYQLVYAGSPRRHRIASRPGIDEFAVAAVDGFGESPMSSPRDTDPAGTFGRDRTVHGGFVRATQSFECGYDEYDPWVEERMPILSYPEPGARA